MTCAEFESLLDGQFGPTCLREDPQLVEHAAACGTCRASWERYRLLADAIVAWRGQAPDVDLTASIMAGLESRTVQTAAQAGAGVTALNPVGSTAGRQPSRKKMVRMRQITKLGRSRRSLVIAVVALMALVTVASWRDPAHSVPSVVPGAVANAGRVTPAPDHNVPHRQDSLIARTDVVRTEEISPYAGLVQLATGAWDEVTLLVRPEFQAAPPETPPQSAAPSGWIDGLQHQLGPIGRGLDNAFDFLWQAGQAGEG